MNGGKKNNPRSCRSMIIILLVIVILIGAKGIWVSATSGHGSFEGEKNVVKSLIEQLECNIRLNKFVYE